MRNAVDVADRPGHDGMGKGELHLALWVTDHTTASNMNQSDTKASIAQQIPRAIAPHVHPMIATRNHTSVMKMAHHASCCSTGGSPETAPVLELSGENQWVQRSRSSSTGFGSPFVVGFFLCDCVGLIRVSQRCSSSHTGNTHRHGSRDFFCRLSSICERVHIR